MCSGGYSRHSRKINPRRAVDSVAPFSTHMTNSSVSEADYLSTLSTSALQDVMRGASTLPVATLLNRQGVTIDFPQRRIWRDSYWKGSFAKDTPMGWEERLLTPIRPDTPPYAGGRF